MRSIDNTDDIIDSRDIDARIDELAEEAADDTIDEGDAEELSLLLAFRDAVDDEGGDGGEWPHGINFIRDSYFEQYAQELAEDIGAIDRNATWPNTCIDWEQAARDLRMDYSAVEFDGVTYWFRS